VSNRIFDGPSVDKLSALVSIAKDNDLTVSIDYVGGIKEGLWIVQIYDFQERLVVTANGKTAIEAIGRLHSNWFAKTAPKT
jgi:hypothetical protein